MGAVFEARFLRRYPDSASAIGSSRGLAARLALGLASGALRASYLSRRKAPLQAPVTTRRVRAGSLQSAPIPASIYCTLKDRKTGRNCL